MDSCSRTEEDGEEGPQGSIQMVPTVRLRTKTTHLTLTQPGFFALWAQWQGPQWSLWGFLLSLSKDPSHGRTGKVSAMQPCLRAWVVESWLCKYSAMLLCHVQHWVLAERESKKPCQVPHHIAPSSGPATALAPLQLYPT